MSALTEFLLARIAEDQAAAASAMPRGPRRNGKAAHRRRITECEVKRHVVEMSNRPVAHAGESIALERVLRALAWPYADHPDYDEAWRP